MFNIPELDDILCKLLSRDDLTQCARVNDMWHKAVIPHIWRNVNLPRENQQRAFLSIVLEDYYENKQNQQLQGNSFGTEKSNPDRQLPYLSPLAKYGPLIRTIDLENLVGFLTLHNHSQWLTTRNSVETGGPKAHEVIDHFLGYCYPIQVSYLNLFEDDFDDEELLESIAAVILPRVCHLRVDSARTGDSLSWLWKQCSNVGRLDVAATGDIVKCLAESMPKCMPKLDKICIGRFEYDKCDLADEKVAALLSGSHKGWKSVELKRTADFDNLSSKALLKHTHTLESFQNLECYVKDNFLAQLLSSSPNLHSVTTIDNRDYFVDSFQKIRVTKFIDMNLATNSIKPWACETSLKVLKIIIINIPRPDLRKIYGKVEEAYLGQGRELQRRVYERLARFVNLEILWLGNDPIMYRSHNDRRNNYNDSLEMSLESGLGMLEGLKSLEELNVSYMEQRIGTEEVKWMADHWPSLKKIYGIGQGNNNKNDDESGDKKRCNSEATKWLQNHCPRIQAQYDFQI